MINIEIKKEKISINKETKEKFNLKSKIALIMILMLSIFLINNNYTFAVSNSNYKEKEELKLSSFSIDGYEFYPDFNANITEYYVSIPTETTSLIINCVPENEGTNVKITGNTNLNKNENTIKINLTKSNSTSKTYYIYANKKDDNDLKLTSLNIENGNLSPEFDGSTYYYDLKVESTKSEVEPLNITYTTSDESANVEILGNTSNELKFGDNNIITIILENDEERTIYQINANIVKKTLITRDINNSKTEEVTNLVKSFGKSTKNYFINFTEKLQNDNNFRIRFIVIAIVIILLLIIINKRIRYKKQVKRNKENLKNRAK